ncbi:hypothetical protein NE852_08825 [Rhizobium sp. Pop5]|uniref:hypothetical protein n=1 Tax=Rhizobium sp. Pop5 TaxID=1223565 RepID=UPI000283A0E5|nr:hypothetical protein [Rhizobium sp. Pop5]EJZ21239.1 hypothetical protein RCCGEPOP_11014 [Rhizobium sp. Pop5]UVD58278.1 hypothetical protein NE852_08825 [Rhizobium sp. Pop5]
MTLVHYLYAGICLLALTAPTTAFSQEKVSSLNGEWTSDCLPIVKNNRHGYIAADHLTKETFRDLYL